MNKVSDENIEIKVNGERAVSGAGLSEVTAERKALKKPKAVGNGKKKCGIITLAVGVVALIAGVAFLLINILKAPTVRDADFLVQVGAWQMQDQPSVEWKFTEIGKGTLTTNAHTNDYNFIWAMDGEKLKIETEWLYTLNDDYTYKLDQGQKTLTLTSGENTYTFVPVADEKGDSAEEN